MIDVKLKRVAEILFNSFRYGDFDVIEIDKGGSIEYVLVICGGEIRFVYNIDEYGRYVIDFSSEGYGRIVMNYFTYFAETLLSVDDIVSIVINKNKIF